MKRTGLLTAAVFGLYLLIAALVTWPLITQFSTAFAGFVYGDAYETAHHVWWFTEALRNGQSPYFQALLAWPDGLTGVTQWADPLHFFPAWLFAFVLPLPAAVNLQTLLTLALNGLAMWGLLRWLLNKPRAPRPPLSLSQAERALAAGDEQPHPLTPSPWGEGENAPTEMAVQPLSQAERALAATDEQPHPLTPSPWGEGENAPAEPGEMSGAVVQVELAAVFAGLIFMLFPAVQGHLGAGHTGLLVLWPLPLFAWALLRLDGAGWRGVLLAAALLLVGAFGHTLQALHALIPLAGLVLLRFAWRREWRAAGKTIVAVALGGVALALFGLPVFSTTFGTGAYADEAGGVRYSADLLAVVTPSFFHPLFGQWEYTHRVLGINLDEGMAFLGFSGLLIGLLALWKAPRSRFWWGVALLAWLLSLGPLLKVFDQPVTLAVDGYSSGVALPFAAIADLPIVRLARTPGRFNSLLGLAWAAILGYGLFWMLNSLRARLGERRGRMAGWAMAAGCAALLIFEFQTFWPLPTARADVPEAIAALRERDDLRAVFDVPWNNLVAAKEGLFLQTAHEHPLIAGQITRRTPVSPARLTLLEETLDPARLREAGADLVIVHRQQEDGALYQRALAQLGAPLYEDERLAVFETPATDQRPEAAVAGFRGGAVTNRAESYFYAPEDGWWSWGARLEADGREVTARLDGQLIGRWTIDGSTPVMAPLPVTAGYHTLTLALEPPCPDDVPAGQQCRGLTVSDLAFEPLTDWPDAPPAAFRAPGETGVSLTMTAALPELAVPGGVLRVPLAWNFETARAETDTRFVHLLNADGVLVAQQDSPPGANPAGEARAEWVSLELPPDLPAGEYRVYAGWYTAPEVVNFCVLADDACVANEALLGVVTVQ